jgi:glucose-6-phosphate dehydrogenase assembly protein OpcA
MTAEEDRTRLIGDIARVLRDGPVPDEARSAALTFIGWLARRMPGEPVSTAGVTVMLRRAAKESTCAEWGLAMRESPSSRGSNGGASRGQRRSLK